MKGGRALPPNFQPNTISDIVDEPHLQDPDAQVEPNFEAPILNEDILSALGFEEGELEMFHEMAIAPGLVTEDDLINRYLEIARDEPYNQNWQTDDEAMGADYELNSVKPNGVAYTKHDIVNDTMDSFYGDITGGKRRKGRKSRKNRKSKKQRKGKKRSTRTRKRSYRK